MNDQHIREQLVNALTKQQAYQMFDDVIKDFPPEHYNTFPTNVPYSFWHLLEHIRIAQWDILEYIVNPDYQGRDWPAEYWPTPDSKATQDMWQNTVSGFRSDLQTLVQIVEDPQRDLCAQIPHAHPGHTILREINVVATHNAYHIGEMGILRQVMGLW